MGRVAGRQTAGEVKEKKKKAQDLVECYSDPQLAKSKQRMKKQREVEQMKG